MEASPAATDPEEVNSNAKKSSLGKQLIGGVFAVLLLWLTFKDSNWQLILHYLKDVQPAYIALLFVSGLTSHFLRAYRWIFLLQPLSDKKISLFNSFYAVMIGYAVNLAIPQGWRSSQARIDLPHRKAALGRRFAHHAHRPHA